MARFVMLDLFAEGGTDGKKEVLERITFEIRIKYHEDINKRRIFECSQICVNKNHILSMEEKEDLCPYIRRYCEGMWWNDIGYRLAKEGGGYINIPHTQIKLTNGKILYVKNSISEILDV